MGGPEHFRSHPPTQGISLKASTTLSSSHFLSTLLRLFVIVGLARAMGVYGFQLVDYVSVTPGLCESFFLWLLVYAFMNSWFVFLVTITLNCALGNFALPRPKMIVLLPGFFCPKMIVRFICPHINLRLKVKYFSTKIYVSKSL
jgi:hypothetical protein